MLLQLRYIQGIYKTTEKMPRASSPHQNKDKSSFQYVSTNSFPCTAQQRVELSPSDFYLCQHIKVLVYSAPIINEETLQCIFNAHQTIPNRPGITARCNSPLSDTPIHACTDTGGGYFQHVLLTVTY